MKWKIAAIAALLLFCYRDVLVGMADQWATDEDMGHGFLVPVAIAWILWRERDRWQIIPAAPSRRGYPLLALGAFMQLAGAVGTGLFAGSVGFLFYTVGAIVALGGIASARTWAFPLLACAISFRSPLPRSCLPTWPIAVLGCASCSASPAGTSSHFASAWCFWFTASAPPRRPAMLNRGIWLVGAFLAAQAIVAGCERLPAFPGLSHFPVDCPSPNGTCRSDLSPNSTAARTPYATFQSRGGVLPPHCPKRQTPRKMRGLFDPKSFVWAPSPRRSARRLAPPAYLTQPE